MLLELENLTFIGVARNFHSNLLLPNDNAETFLFNKNILELFFEHFYCTKLAYPTIEEKRDTFKDFNE